MSREATSGMRSQKSAGFKGSAMVASGEGALVSESSETTKDTFSPHDSVGLDVLEHLTQSGRVRWDIEEAPPGAIVHAKGSLVFLDQGMMDLLFSFVDMHVTTEKKKPKQEMDQSLVRTWEMVQRVLPKIQFPSLYLLRTTKGSTIVGTLKKDGLDESIASFYFKGGLDGIPNVELIGVKEDIAQGGVFVTPGGLLPQVSKIFTDMIATVLPKADLRASALVLYRSLA